MAARSLVFVEPKKITRGALSLDPSRPLFTVVTATIGRPTLFNTCQSVVDACELLVEVCGGDLTDFAGPLVQHSVMLDGPDVVPALNPSYVQAKTNKVHINIMRLSEKGGKAGSVCRSHGTRLATGNIVMYLDDDNWFEPDVFVEVYRHFVQNADPWTFFFRYMVHKDNHVNRFPEACESVGTLAPKTWYEEDSFVDTNCYALRDFVAKELHGAWILPANQTLADDRQFYNVLIKRFGAPKKVLTRFLVDYEANANLFFSTAAGMCSVYGDVVDVENHPDLAMSGNWRKEELDILSSWSAGIIKMPLYGAHRERFCRQASNLRPYKGPEEEPRKKPIRAEAYHFMIAPGTDLALAEVASFAKCFYKEKGIPCTSSPKYYRPKNGVVVVLGATKIEKDPNYPLDSTIIWNMEHLYDESPWIAPESTYRAMLQKYKVWDFNESNKTYLIEKMNKKREDIAVVKLGFCKDLVYAPLTPEEEADTEPIDVLFYGGLPHRRQIRLNAIVKKCKRKGYRVMGYNNCLAGNEKRKAMLRAKVIVNLHLYLAMRLESTRLVQAMHNECFVLSELSKDDDDYVDLQDGFARENCDADHIDSFANKVVEWIENDAERQRIAKKGKEAVMNRESWFPMVKIGRKQ